MAWVLFWVVWVRALILQQVMNNLALTQPTWVVLYQNSAMALPKISAIKHSHYPYYLMGYMATKYMMLPGRKPNSSMALPTKPPAYYHVGKNLEISPVYQLQLTTVLLIRQQ